MSSANDSPIGVRAKFLPPHVRARKAAEAKRAAELEKAQLAQHKESACDVKVEVISIKDGKENVKAGENEPKKNGEAELVKGRKMEQKKSMDRDDKKAGKVEEIEEDWEMVKEIPAEDPEEWEFLEKGDFGRRFFVKLTMN